MREIKFRGKRKDNGDWVYGYYIGICAENTNDKHFIASKNNGIKYEINSDTLGEYAGIKDMYDEDIYEGDILDDMSNGKKYIAEFMEGSFILNEIDIKNKKITYDDFEKDQQDRDQENIVRGEFMNIIDNIYKI